MSKISNGLARVAAAKVGGDYMSDMKKDLKKMRGEIAAWANEEYFGEVETEGKKHLLAAEASLRKVLKLL